MAKKKKTETTDDEQIIIDAQKSLVFSSEDEVLDHFSEQIQQFEKEFLKLRTKGDFSDDESLGKEDELEELLQSPDEVWEDSQSNKSMTVYNFIKSFQDEEDETFYYLAIAYFN